MEDDRTLAHYQAARSFATTFAGAGIGVLVAILTYEVAIFIIKSQSERFEPWQWLWAVEVWVITLLCFFRLYWLHWNDVCYLWPFDRFILFVVDVSAYLSGCLWILFMSVPGLWPTFATLTFLFSYGRTRHIYHRGPLPPRGRDSVEWAEYTRRYQRFAWLYWICASGYAVLAVVSFLLWWQVGGFQTGDTVYHHCVVPIEGAVLLLLAAVANWPPAVVCPLFPMVARD